MVDWDLGEYSLKLCTDERVFFPTLTSKLVAGCLTIQPGDDVLDIGCGVGQLGITAAKKGARLVLCLDIMTEACRLAKRNALLNGVAERVHVVNSDLFGALRGKQFDVIIDDVSGIADEVARISTWFPHPIPTGGEDGAGPVVRMLGEVTRFLKPGGKLYLPMSSLSCLGRIIGKAKEVFDGGLELVMERLIPFSPELYQHIDLLERLRQRGWIDYVAKKSRYLWNLQVFVGTRGTASALHPSA